MPEESPKPGNLTPQSFLFVARIGSMVSSFFLGEVAMIDGQLCCLSNELGTGPGGTISRR